MSELYKQDSLGWFDYESYDTCELYLWGKMTESPFRRKGEHASELLRLIHSNVYGPMSTQAHKVSYTLLSISMITHNLESWEITW